MREKLGTNQQLEAARTEIRRLSSVVRTKKTVEIIELLATTDLPFDVRKLSLDVLSFEEFDKELTPQIRGLFTAKYLSKVKSITAKTPASSIEALLQVGGIMATRFSQEEETHTALTSAWKRVVAQRGETNTVTSKLMTLQEKLAEVYSSEVTTTPIESPQDALLPMGERISDEPQDTVRIATDVEGGEDSVNGVFVSAPLNDGQLVEGQEVDLVSLQNTSKLAVLSDGEEIVFEEIAPEAAEKHGRSKRYIPSLERLEANDQEEWSRWIESLQSVLTGLAIKIVKQKELAEEIVQEAWINITRDVREGQVTNPEFINTWAGRILINVAIKLLRKENRTVIVDTGSEADESLINLLPAKGEDIGDIIGHRDEIVRLVPYIARLSPEHQKILAILPLDLSVNQIAERFGIPQGTVKSRTSRAREALRKVIEGDPSEDVDQETGSSKENEQRREEEQKWLRTLTREGMTLGRAVKYLRLSKGYSQIEYTKKSKVDDGQISKIENDRIKPRINTLNSFIEASPLSSDSKAAQLLRLIMEKRNPMSLAELRNCSFGELFKYLRQLNGISQFDFSKPPFGMKQPAISSLEKGRRNPSKDIGEKLVKTLALDPESALAKIILYKTKKNKEEIPNELLYNALSTQYLFQEHLQMLEQNELSSKDKQLREQIAKKKRIGEKVRYLRTLKRFMRNEKKLTQKQLGEEIIGGENIISDIEAGRKIPEDFIIVRIMEALGFDIHHPLTWDMLDCVGQERKERSIKAT